MPFIAVLNRNTLHMTEGRYHLFSDLIAAWTYSRPYSGSDILRPAFKSLHHYLYSLCRYLCCCSLPTCVNSSSNPLLPVKEEHWHTVCCQYPYLYTFNI